MKSHRRNERGVALVAVAVFMAMILALAVVGIDVGHLAHTATEAQSVADTAALAGALALADNRDAGSDAYAVASHNVFNGAAASPDEITLELGTWQPDTGFVLAGAGSTATAVRATAHTEVRNIVAGVFGPDAAHSPVGRVALAAYTGKGSCDPEKDICFPVCIGECYFQSLDQCFNDPSCLPHLGVMPSTVDNSGWTPLTIDITAADSNILELLPRQCRDYTQKCKQAEGATSTDVAVGVDINVTQGTLDKTLLCLDDCYDDGSGPLADLELTVPICECTSNFNQSAEVVGFASIKVSGVQTTGNGKGITVNFLQKNDTDGPGGGIANTQTGGVKMICDRDAGQCG